MSDKPTKKMPTGVIKLDIGCFTQKTEKEMEEESYALYKALTASADAAGKTAPNQLQKTAEARAKHLKDLIGKLKK